MDRQLRLDVGGRDPRVGTAEGADMLTEALQSDLATTPALKGLGFRV